jgi:peptide deformylase
MKYKIVQFPNIGLISKTKPVEFLFNHERKRKELPEEILENIKEMRFTMKNVQGFHKDSTLGISANQVGCNFRVMLISKYPNNYDLKTRFSDIYINPEIIEVSETTTIKWEGCLSDSEKMVLRERPKKAIIKYYNTNGIEKIESLSEIKSRIALHEIDHLDGIDLYNETKERKILEVIPISHFNENKINIIDWCQVEKEKGYLF